MDNSRKKIDMDVGGKDEILQTLNPKSSNFHPEEEIILSPDLTMLKLALAWGLEY